MLYTSTRTLKPSEDSEPTALKVDIAPWNPLKYSLMGALQVQMNEIGQGTITSTTWNWNQKELRRVSIATWVAP